MVHRVYQQPDGRFAVYSSVVSAFLFVDGTEREIRDFLGTEWDKSTRQIDTMLTNAKAGEYPHHGCPADYETAVELAEANSR